MKHEREIRLEFEFSIDMTGLNVADCARPKESQRERIRSSNIVLATGLSTHRTPDVQGWRSLAVTWAEANQTKSTNPTRRYTMKSNRPTLNARRLSLAALMALGLAFSPTARADQEVSAQVSLPIRINGIVNETDCNNSHGPTISLEGQVVLGGLQVQLIFKNNLKGTHTTTVTYSTNVLLIPLNTAITIPKQPVQGGVGGNPHIWIQFHDGAGHDLTDEIYLGRCVQGLAVSPSFLGEVLAAADISALDCSNNPGPIISVGGTITFAGLHARFIFSNNLKGTHTADATRDVEIIVNGSQTTIPKQPVHGGAGGNPIISIDFLDGDGHSLTEPVVLGRCVQL